MFYKSSRWVLTSSQPESRCSPRAWGLAWEGIHRNHPVSVEGCIPRPQPNNTFVNYGQEEASCCLWYTLCVIMMNAFVNPPEVLLHNQLMDLEHRKRRRRVTSLSNLLYKADHAAQEDHIIHVRMDVEIPESEKNMQHTTTTTSTSRITPFFKHCTQ